MKTILKITKNELSSLFYSPIAWLILIIFTFQSGMAYADGWAEILRRQALGYSLYDVTKSLLLGWQGAISGMQENLNITGDRLSYSILPQSLTGKLFLASIFL